MGHRRAALAVALVALAASRAQATRLARGPYLQQPTTHSVIVVWTTDVPASCAVAVGPPGGEPSTVIDGGSGPGCAVTVDGLDPGTPYAYTPLADGTPLGLAAIFRTDDPAAPVSFLVLGDSGCACSAQLAVRDAMLRTPADFIIHTGDMAYDSGTPEQLDAGVFGPYRELMQRLPLWPAIGNHDVRTAAGQPWRDAFVTPANNPAANENYYSFDAGNAHIVVLDSNASTRPGSAQYDFLDLDLAASAATWKIVVFHHTIYSSGTIHGSNRTVRANLVPLMQTRGVDLVLTGHEHTYERTWPLHDDAVVPPDQGIVYITTGGGGHHLYPVGSSAFTAYSESVAHFVRIAIDGETLLAQMIRADGTIGDATEIAKETAAPPRVCGDGLVDRPDESCDGADAAHCAGPCAPDCTCEPVCGDTHRTDPESCDGADDTACPGRCLTGCACGDPSRFVTLHPAADTYIVSGSEAARDHGAATSLDAGVLPEALAYLKFDLSAVTAPVVRAVLRMTVAAGSDGGTIYPVPDSTWIEGDATGGDPSSAQGAGLKWTDVDTNGDGFVDARDASPYVPDASRPLLGFGTPAVGSAYTADVTAAFGGGPGVYTLAIRNDFGATTTYSSREGSDPPELRLELAGVDGTTTTTTVSPATSSTSETASTATVTSTSDTSSTASSSTETPSTGTSSTETPSTATSSTATASTATSTTEAPSTEVPSTSTTTATTPSTSTTSSTSTSAAPTSTAPASTSTSRPASTSTTTLRAACLVDAECDLGDPCTAYRCTPAGCRATPLIGFAAVRCAFEGDAPSACAGATIPRDVDRRFATARDVVERAGGAESARNAKVLGRRAVRLLRRTARAVRAAERTGRLDRPCGDALRNVFDDARRRAVRWLSRASA